MKQEELKEEKMIIVPDYKKENEWLRKELYRDKTIIDALVFYIKNKDKE